MISSSKPRALSHISEQAILLSNLIDMNGVSTAVHWQRFIAVENYLTSRYFVSQCHCQTQLVEAHFQTRAQGVTPIMNFCNMEDLLLKLLSGRLSPILLHLQQL